MSLNLEDPFNLMSDVAMNSNNDNESSISDDSNDLVNDSGKNKTKNILHNFFNFILKLGRGHFYKPNFGANHIKK